MQLIVSSLGYNDLCLSLVIIINLSAPSFSVQRQTVILQRYGK
ncbi:hypothetical protein BACUNI_02415 [Bacteroides uniformis ATCC 8492]|uniref:Uncharacterized protein n=1 Tax=Bacteroides uniformis (strain ATCC 8492 / DSM 6597 / CCUG 4942 / CIP 103695 / JCM 5828 / KCTC 5204 / NCTC 13054 / VPI 0061) TaxID=411479 RepID=A0ABC9NAV3_BACUC|nr:hypothetical protein BACUNI_02415 [Bacteroides uniformis ATCC 8492]